MNTPFDDIQDTGSRISLRLAHSLVLGALLDYESVAEEFGFEPYGTVDDEIDSYNRHMRFHAAQLEQNIGELRERIAIVKGLAEE